MKICIILPTFNEKGNVLNIFQKIKKQKLNLIFYLLMTIQKMELEMK